MKFSIQEAGGEKQIFFTFKEASEKTGLTSKNIARVLKSGRNKYFRRSDKKTFWIQNEEITPFISHFLDSQEKSHEVTWKSDDLEKFISLLKEAKMIGNVAPATFRGAKKADKKLCEKTLENILICNGIEGVL